MKDNEIQRYIRLILLIPELLDLVDTEELPLMAGVDLSHIDEQAQTAVYHYFFVLHPEIRIDIKISSLINTRSNLNHYLGGMPNARGHEAF